MTGAFGAPPLVSPGGTTSLGPSPAQPAHVLLVDDEESVLVTLQAVLQREGYQVSIANSGSAAQELLQQRLFQAALLDIRLDDVDGIDFLGTLHAHQPDCAVIMLTGFASLESAVLAIRQGAYDYLMKPCDLKELKMTVARAVERAALSSALRERVAELERANETIRGFAEELQKRVDDATIELRTRVAELAAANRDLEETRRRLDFLSRAGTVLASSLDFETTLKRLAKLAVPVIADWCSVFVLETDGSLRRLELAHVDLAKTDTIQQLHQFTPLPESPHHPVAIALRTGRPVFRPAVSEEDLLRMARGPKHLELLRELGYGSNIVVPLRARDRVVGAIGLVAGYSGRRFTEADLSLAEELGRRAGIAIDNALLYKEAQQAVAARNEFLSVAAHELKTPTSTIKAYAQLLRRRGPGGMQDLSALEVVNQQADHLTRLVQELLDLSRLEVGRLDLSVETLDLGQVAEEALARIEPIARGHRFELQQEHGVLVRADRDRFDQVIANLLDNAVKFSPRGEPILVGVSAKGGWGVLSVRDYGIGVPADKQEHIFERYYRAHSGQEYEGLGIGLHLAREIMQRHGGSIWFESREGEGSTFYCSLPLA